MNWLTTFTEFFGADSWQVLALACVIGFLTFASSFVKLVWSAKGQRITHLKSILEVETLSPEVKFVLVEDFNRSLFLQATGIAGDKYMREKYRELLEKSEGDLTINQLRRASRFLEFEDKVIVANKDRSRRMGYMFDKWYPLILLCGAIAQLLTIIFIDSTEVSLFVQWGLVCISLVMAIFLRRQAVNYEVALMIEEFQSNLQ